jgi:serine/threonine protein kinase
MNTSQANPAMPSGNQCPRCGATLPAGALAGLCPACLLKQGAAADTAPLPDAAPFTPPGVAELARLFPQLEILSFIGQGGMGAVYKARQPALDRFVALKVLPPQAAPGVNFAERFNREARALAKLSHPNIVAVYDFGQAGALHYLIMEFVDGANLRQLIRSGRLAPREALAVVPQICDALQFAHDEGVVHRDIKPENILVDRRGRVKITDFGLAKILGIETGASRLTREGTVMGTPHYMAPEQVEHPQTVDHRADIYSLGVVFYEMLTGELPLGKFPAPSQKVHVDVRLDEVVLHALEKEPERRYQQASEVKTAVETIVTTPAAHPDIEPARIARDSMWFGASTLPDLLPGERIVHFKKRLWAVFNKSLPLVYRLFFSLPPFWSAGLYITDRRLLFASHFFGVLNQQFSIWFSDKAPDARRERFASADIGKGRWFGDFLEIKSKSPRRQWWRSTDLTLRLYMRQPEMVQKTIAAAETCVVSAASVSAEAAASPEGGRSTAGVLASASAAADVNSVGKQWQSPTTGWGYLIGQMFGITFMSPLAFKLANLSALGFLCFLGFMPLPGWQRCFGFSGLFGLIGVAFLIEMIARSKAGAPTVGVPASGELAQHAASPLPVLQFWEALEDGDYARAWEKTAAYFQRDSGKDEWVARMEKTRRPLGKAVRREQLPFCWLNVGTRQETRCKTTFGGGRTAEEAAVVALQPNGEWRVESYRLDLVEAASATLPPEAGTACGGALASAGPDAALRQVKGPATGLISTAILNWVAIPAIVMAMVFVGAGSNSLIGDGLIVVPIIAFVLCTMMLIGALKMKRLESQTWAVAASMLAMFISPGNIIGLPLGIWALFVLGRPEVRGAFRQQRPPQEPTPRDTLLGRLALGLFIGGLLGTIAIMATSPRHEMALVFGAVALVLALVFGAMGWRERLGRLAVFCTLAALVGLPTSLFSAFWTEQACSIVTWLPRAKEQKRAMIERQKAVMQARLGQTTQDVLKDLQPDGTIRFKTTVTQRNTIGEPLKALRFSNSDFIRVDKLTDAQGRTLPFTFTRTGKITLRYEATLAEPVKPGAEFSYVMEGTETGPVKPLAQPGGFEYTMRHWPGSSRTRRIERHLLPAGAQLLSKEPADLTERTRDGRVELFIEHVILGGDSLEVRYTFRLPTKP